jgi:hypothetical protein
MMETLYVPGSPVWTGIPPTGFGWIHTGIPMGGATTGSAMGPSPQLPQLSQTTSAPNFADSIGPGRPGPTISSPTPPFSPFGYASGITSLGQPGLTPFGPFAGAPALLGSEFTTAIPATALLATVAMRRGQPQGPTSDTEVEEFLYDAFELLAGASDVEVRNEGGRATLTGSVPHKRLKRDIGEIAWAIPGVNDVQNNVTITARRRSRTASREPEAHSSHTPVRKQA